MSDHDTLCERLIALSKVSSDIMERHNVTESEMKTIVERLAELAAYAKQLQVLEARNDFVEEEFH